MEVKMHQHSDTPLTPPLFLSLFVCCALAFCSDQYGFFPQTWEDPSYINEQTGYPGDNDPIDVLDIGAKQLRTGEIIPVKILGVLALIDDGETDWKVIAISISDAMAHMLNDIDDVETHLPGTIKAIREYFRGQFPHSPSTVQHPTARVHIVRCCQCLLTR